MIDLSGREKKLLQMIFDLTGGDVSKIVVGFYQLAGTNGFDEHNVFNISNLLSGFGLLIMQTIEGEKTATGANAVKYVKLTSSGVSYVRSLEQTTHKP